MCVYFFLLLSSKWEKVKKPTINDVQRLYVHMFNVFAAFAVLLPFYCRHLHNIHTESNAHTANVTHLYNKICICIYFAKHDTINEDSMKFGTTPVLLIVLHITWITINVLTYWNLTSNAMEKNSKMKITDTLTFEYATVDYRLKKKQQQYKCSFTHFRFIAFLLNICIPLTCISNTWACASFSEGEYLFKLCKLF